MFEIKTLPVPYTSQLSAGATSFNNDCGAACVSMLLKAYIDSSPTVDSLYAETNKPADMYLSFGDLQKLLLARSIDSSYYAGLTEEKLFKFLRQEKPFIALIHYGTLRKFINPPTTFTGAHFCVVFAFDPYTIRIHDPLWYNTDGAHLIVEFNDFMQAWDDAYLDNNARKSALVPNLGIKEYKNTISNPIYDMKIIVNWLTIRTTPGVKSWNHTGKYLQFGTQIKVHDTQALNNENEIWVAITPQKDRWCAVKYNNEIYAKVVQE